MRHEVIRNVHDTLQHAFSAVRDAVHPLKRGGEENQQFTRAADALDEFVRYFHGNRLDLPNEVIPQLAEVALKLKRWPMAELSSL